MVYGFSKSTLRQLEHLDVEGLQIPDDIHNKTKLNSLFLLDFKAAFGQQTDSPLNQPETPARTQLQGGTELALPAPTVDQIVENLPVEVERQPGKEHFVDDEHHRPVVNLATVEPLLHVHQALDGGVGGRAAQAAGTACPVENITGEGGVAKVDDFDGWGDAGFVDQDVLKFEVAVDNGGAMQNGHTLDELLGDGEGVGYGEAALVEEVFEVGTDVVHVETLGVDCRDVVVDGVLVVGDEVGYFQLFLDFLSDFSLTVDGFLGRFEGQGFCGFGAVIGSDLALLLRHLKQSSLFGTLKCCSSDLRQLLNFMNTEDTASGL